MEPDNSFEPTLRRGDLTQRMGAINTRHSHQPRIGEPIMQLGNFYVSLAVKDIAASRAFYEKLGFTVWGGDQAQTG